MNTISTAWIVSGWLCLALAPGASQASDQSSDEAQDVLPASSCPAMFGSQISQAMNTTRRKEHLEEVQQGEHLVSLQYNGGWQAPERIRYKGLELIGVRDPGGSGSLALIRMDPVPEGIACKPGVYTVRVDDSIGAAGQVMAILEDVILIEHADELRYLTRERNQTPAWRMIWRSTWTIAGTQPMTSSSSSSAKRPNRPSHAGRTKPKAPKPARKHTSRPAR